MKVKLTWSIVVECNEDDKEFYKENEDATIEFFCENTDLGTVTIEDTDEEAEGSLT